jgi:hypothetical protein
MPVISDATPGRRAMDSDIGALTVISRKSY